MGFRDRIAQYNKDKAQNAAISTTEAATGMSHALGEDVKGVTPIIPVNPPEASKVLEEQTLPETEGQPEPKAAEPEKKTRAPRGSKKPSEQPKEPEGSDAANETTEDLVAILKARGYTVTLTS